MLSDSPPTMDPRTILNYAMFQLTPTRTRYDIVVYSGAVKEKIASGLFEPFVCHLKFVNDEISKGGYSIKLLPNTKGVLWFSKQEYFELPHLSPPSQE